MLTSHLDYHLPPDRIATEPAHPRDSAKLLIADRATGQIFHRQIRDLPDLIANSPDSLNLPKPGDLMVFNQTRVLPARFSATRTQTHGHVQGLFIEEPPREHDCHWVVMLESGGKLRESESLELDTDARLELLQRLGDGQWLAKLHSPDNTRALLNRIGSPPLPPYIQRQRKQRDQPLEQPHDEELYNTVYATDPGSIAAPTAGLHFTNPLIDQLDHAGIKRATVTLHVGLGTFAPVRTQRLEDHPIHRERIHIPAHTIAAITQTRAQGHRIIPVGTTTVRALESLPDPLPTDSDFTTDTDLFITPDNFTFRFTDALMTNFHLPQSTLIALVAALPDVGLDRIKAWYQTAIDHRYRFYSFGDAMLIL